MKTYLLRSVKYFVALCVLYTLLMWLMHVTGSTPYTLRDDLNIMLHTRNGYMMLGAMVLLSAIYPLVGFTTRRVEGDVVQDREQLLTALDMYGFGLRSEADGVMTFRARGLKRLWLLFEDEIRVTQYAQWIEIHGMRRQVVRVMIRLGGYLSNKRRAQ